MLVAAAVSWPSSIRADDREPVWDRQSPAPQADSELPDAQEHQAPADPDSESAVSAEDEAARHAAIRNCHTCDHGPFRFDIAIPLFVPIVAMEMIPDDGSEGMVEFETGLTFGASLGFDLRTGPVTTHVSALGLGLGSQRLTFREGTDVAQINLLGMIAQAHLQWNAPSILLGSGSSAPRLALWPMAGARVLVINGTVDATRRDLDETLAHVDPYVGLETILDFAGPWSIEVNLSAGGFTIGNDISLVGEVGAQHHFTHWLLLRFGYFAFYATDSDTGSMLFKDFEFLAHGPLIGLHFSLQ